MSETERKKNDEALTGKYTVNYPMELIYSQTQGSRSSDAVRVTSHSIKVVNIV